MDRDKEIKKVLREKGISFELLKRMTVGEVKKLNEQLNKLEE